MKKGKVLSKSSKIAIIVTAMVFILAMFFVFIFMFLGNSDDDTKISESVLAEKSEVLSEFEIVIPKEQKYEIHAEWTCEQEVGFISGIAVTDDSGKEVFACTGDIVDAYSNPIVLPKGKCHIVISSLVNEEDFNEYVRLHGMEAGDGDEFTNYQKGSYDMTYTVGISNSTFTAYRFGLIFGVFFGICIFVLFLVVSKTGDSLKLEYDERQIANREKGYKYGYRTLTVYVLLMMFVDLLEIEMPMDNSVIIAIGLVISLEALITYCVWHDCYFALNERPKTLMVIFVIGAVLNVFSSIGNIKTGTVIVDGKLSTGFLNILCVVFFMYLFIVLAAKAAKDRREEADDE